MKTQTEQRSIFAGALIQDSNSKTSQIRSIYGKSQLNQDKLNFFVNILKYIKSNAIALFDNDSLVSQSGGQTSRVDALQNCFYKLKLKHDYKKLKNEFIKRGKLLRAYYYTALIENEENSPLRPLVDWLTYNGYTIVSKPAKEFTDSAGQKRIKGNMDIELAIDAMELAPNVEHIIIFSGDGDFQSLVKSLQRQGVRVSVVSTTRSHPPMIADELRRQADNYIDLEELRDVISQN